MAFMIHTVEDGHVPAFEYLPAGAITPKVGMALVQSGGNLAVANAVAPTYISMMEANAALTAGTKIPVIRVTPDIVFETTNTASLASVAIGSKVTMHTDGMQVTATTTSGVAEIVGKDADAAGSRVLVRFA